ncbi:MAG TPA: peroxiredoxin [Rhizomicrobium sp.]|jgi:peroxiredoxin Q/BCP
MARQLSAGDPAPDVEFPTDQAGDISLATLRGKVLVLYFYPKDDTAGCTNEALAFSASKKRFDAAGIKVIGVSKDSIASHQKFRLKHKLTILLASDPETKIAEAYGVWVEKSLYGRRYMGMERATFLIDANGVIRQVWHKVRVAGHVEAVFEAGRSLSGAS